MPRWIDMGVDANRRKPLAADDAAAARSPAAGNVPALPGIFRRELCAAAVSGLSADAACADGPGGAVPGISVESLRDQPAQFCVNHPVSDAAHPRRPLPLFLYAL